MGRGSHGLAPEQLSERLENGGLRFTPQRRHVYRVLSRKPDHPTAEEVFIRAKREMPEISLATVYNCLEALVRCGLARQVNVQRGASRFCPNMREHCHFWCDACERIYDIDLPERSPWTPPDGFMAHSYDITIHGICPACGEAKRPSGSVQRSLS